MTQACYPIGSHFCYPRDDLSNALDTLSNQRQEMLRPSNQLTDNTLSQLLIVGTHRVNSPKSSVIHLTNPI